MYRVPAVLILFVAVSGFSAGLKLEKNQPVDPGYWNDYSIEELILYRNSLFARYGYAFKSSALSRHFLSLGWYKPDKSFSYAMLTRIDQQNVNAILAVEKKKVGELKSSITEAKAKTKRYFLTASEKDRVPASTEGEMKRWWQKKAGSLYQRLRVPVALTVALSGEKDAAFADARSKDCRKSFSYWEAGYDDKGRLRVLKHYLCEDDGYGDWGDVYYFNEKEQLLLVQGKVLGTTVNYEYYYQYCLGSVVWIEVTLINGSAGIPNETEKFFY